MLQGFSSIGGLYVYLIAWAMLENLGWRLLSFFTAILPLVALFLCLFLKESVMWLISQGQVQRAKKVHLTRSNFTLSVPKGGSRYSEVELRGDREF